MKNLLLIPIIILLGLIVALGLHALTGMAMPLLALIIAAEIPAMFVAGGITIKAYNLYRERYADTETEEALWLPWSLAAASMVAISGTVGLAILLGVFFFGLELPNGFGGVLLAYSIAVLMIVALIPAYQIAKRADWLKWLPPIFRRGDKINGS